ncbi:MAG: glycosyltransferase family 4 protein [Paludibacteraceae bacterium]
MRVLFVLHFGAANDGSSTALRRFLPLLQARGVEPLVILPLKGNLRVVLMQSNIPAVSLKYNYRFSVYPPRASRQDKLLFLYRLVGRWLVNTCSMIQLLCIAKRFHPDIIHTNSSVCAIGYQVSRLLRVPHVWHIREYGFTYCYMGRQLRRYQNKRSYTICITKDIQRYNKLINAPRSRVIYDGVLSIADLCYNIQKRPYFLFAGRIEKIKGVFSLLNAYAQYRKTCVRPLPLYIAGREVAGTDYAIKCHRFVTENELTQCVQFLGARTDIMSLYQEATALIVPSLAEGFGFITAEAMFSGCLVVGNDVAGTKEQFDNGVELTGEEIALRYTQQEQLVQHMLDITDALEKGRFTEQYEPMILRAQQVVQQLYTSERNAEQIYSFYHDILRQ